MSKAQKLTKRQRAVIEDLFTAEMDEQEVLEKHNVNRALYNRWQAEDRRHRWKQTKSDACTNGSRGG